MTSVKMSVVLLLHLPLSVRSNSFNPQRCKFKDPKHEYFTSDASLFYPRRTVQISCEKFTSHLALKKARTCFKICLMNAKRILNEC